MAMCATCQCYLESDTDLPPQSDAELDMLDQAFFVKPNSRLGCQIHISEDIDGIVLRLAPVITSYSIHYTKLYETGPPFISSICAEAEKPVNIINPINNFFISFIL